MGKPSNYRWFVVAVFFLFMLLHQADKLLIGPLTTPIMKEFGIDEVQMGAVFTGALLVGAVLYPLWGYLYDRFAAPSCWPWLRSSGVLPPGSEQSPPHILPSLPAAPSTGIDNSSYPGLYSLISDYFGPSIRGKVYGLIQIAGPLGYMLGLIVATYLGATLGWRGVFYLTGSLGIVLSVVIFFGDQGDATWQERAGDVRV